MQRDVMLRAIELAKMGKGLVSPNPVVGCVLVLDGEIVAEGYHKKAGGAHAEVEALSKVNFRAEGCEMYVTLEPCAHYGKTGPCCEAVVAAGVKRVFIGMKDPSKEVCGKGAEYLVANGVEVVWCEKEFGEELKVLNQSFLKSCSGSEFPYVVMKSAMSLDGKICDFEGRSKWITGEVARADAKIERSMCDAVLVGANTVRLDDCELGVAEGFDKKLLRVVLGDESLNSDLKIFRDDQVIVLGGDLRKILKFLKSEYGVESVFVEGGRNVHEQFLAEGLVDRLVLYYAGVWLGKSAILDKVEFSLLEALRLERVSVELKGEDVKMCGFLKFY